MARSASNSTKMRPVDETIEVPAESEAPIKMEKPAEPAVSQPVPAPPQAAAPAAAQPEKKKGFLRRLILPVVVLAAIGLDPWNIVESLRRLADWIWNLGFDAINSLWRYFILGAVIVVPLWLLSRLFGARPR